MHLGTRSCLLRIELKLNLFCFQSTLYPPAGADTASDTPRTRVEGWGVDKPCGVVLIALVILFDTAGPAAEGTGRG